MFFIIIACATVSKTVSLGLHYEKDSNGKARMFDFEQESQKLFNVFYHQGDQSSDGGESAKGQRKCQCSSQLSCRHKASADCVRATQTQQQAQGMHADMPGSGPNFFFPPTFLLCYFINKM